MQEPNRPALTPAQIAAAVIAVIAPLADLLRVFGVYDLTSAQQSAVNNLILALAAFAAVLVTADAYLRGKRNDAHAKVAAVAAIKRNETPKPVAATSGFATGGIVPSTGATWTEPRPGAAVTNVVTAPTDAPDEPGDEDALPDYETTTVVPPDEGDSAPEAST